MLSFNEILEKVEHEISQLSFEYPPKSLYDPIEYILSLGGKRIRPALALMACNLYKENIDNVINPALGVEVFHNFTLLHDDLMDKCNYYLVHDAERRQIAANGYGKVKEFHNFEVRFNEIFDIVFNQKKDV